MKKWGWGVSFCLRKDEKFLVTAAGFEINTKSKNSFFYVREKRNEFFIMVNPVFDPELGSKVEKSKLLVVGAGGIGCELLKNLVLTGFKNITAVRVKVFF